MQFRGQVGILHLANQLSQGGGEGYWHRRQQALGIAVGYTHIQLVQVAPRFNYVGQPAKCAVNLNLGAKPESQQQVVDNEAVNRSSNQAVGVNLRVVSPKHWCPIGHVAQGYSCPVAYLCAVLHRVLIVDHHVPMLIVEVGI